MEPERVAPPDRGSRRWFAVGGASGDPVGPARPLDERSMRALEVLIAGLVLSVVALLSLAQPPDGQSLRVVEVVALGGVLFVAALVSLIR